MIVHSSKTDFVKIREDSEKRLAPKPVAPHQQKLGMGDFLHLMISQLQYQDPLHPMNNTRFAAQLAQFSQLDQLTHLNKGVGHMVHSGSDANKMMMVGFLGQEVTLKGNGFHLEPGDSVGLKFRLGSPAGSGHLHIFDEQHHLVRTMELKSMAPGSHTVPWDGVTNQGDQAPKGRYSFEVEAMDGRHKAISAVPVQTGVVTGILFSKGEPVLEVNGKPVAFKDISHVGRPEGTVRKKPDVPSPALSRTLSPVSSRMPSVVETKGKSAKKPDAIH